jgi:Aerotolerance regulator N-terminal
MTFLQPWFLWGLLAGVIPLLVHLFDRRRPRVVPFAALAFVIRSQKRAASRLRLKKILLYALRTLALVAVPLALARPTCSQSQTAALSKGLMATALVVDVSFATRYDGLQARVLQEAQAALASLSAEEPVALVVCNDNPRAVLPLGFERQPVLVALEELRPTYGRVDLNRCLDMGLEALSDSPLPGRRLVVVSALTQNALSLSERPPEFVDANGQGSKPEVVLRDVARQALPNLAFTDVKVEPAPQLGMRGWQFLLTVKNFSDDAVQNRELQLLVNGEVMAKSFIDVGPHASVQKVLSHRFEKSGVLTVTAQLDTDGLPDDNLRTMVVSVAQERTALVVNGAPSSQKVKDEAFFIEAALSSAGSPVKAVVRDADSAQREDLAKYDALLLLNVRPPPIDFVEKIQAFVDSGKGLFISMGDNLEPDAVNAAYRGLLPRSLRVVKTAAENKQEGHPAQIETLDTQSPLLTPFVGAAKEGLLATKLYKYILFEAEDKSHPSRVIATLDDGAPLMVVSSTDKKRVVMFASSVDTDWTDLPIRTAFLPLMQRSVAWLSGALDERENFVGQVGQSAQFSPRGTIVSRLQSPTGSEVLLKNAAPQAAPAVPLPVPASQGEKRTENMVATEALPEPGRYEVMDEKQKPIDSLAFAAIIDPLASDLTRQPLADVTAWFGEATVRSAEASQPEKQVPFATWLFVALAVALFAEGLLLQKT